MCIRDRRRKQMIGSANRSEESTLFRKSFITLPSWVKVENNPQHPVPTAATRNKPQRTPNESPTGTDETGTETDKNGKKAEMKPPSIFPRKSLLVAATT